MGEEIRWESSLIKKFGCSNHYKLLSQLKTEVKAFPLKRKNPNTASHERKNNSESFQSAISNLKEPNICPTVEDRLNKIKNQQSQSLFKSKHNSFNSRISSKNDSTKGIINQFRTNNNEHEEKLTNIYNNNVKVDTILGESELSKINSKVSFNETELID